MFFFPPDFQLAPTEENSFLYPELQMEREEEDTIPPLPAGDVEIQQNIVPLTADDEILEEENLPGTSGTQMESKIIEVVDPARIGKFS